MFTDAHREIGSRHLSALIMFRTVNLQVYELRIEGHVRLGIKSG